VVNRKGMDLGPYSGPRLVHVIGRVARDEKLMSKELMLNRSVVVSA